MKKNRRAFSSVFLVFAGVFVTLVGCGKDRQIAVAKRELTSKPALASTRRGESVADSVSERYLPVQERLRRHQERIQIALSR